MCSSRETESSKDLFCLNEDNDSVIHQTFEKAPNDEIISTARSVYSRASRKGTKVLKGITKQSMKRLIAEHKSLAESGLPGQRTQSIRFKSKYPHVALKCRFFEGLDKGWLVRRFDAQSKSSILFNNLNSLALVNFEVREYRFELQNDVLELRDDFFGAFSRMPDIDSRLLCYSTFKDKAIVCSDFAAQKTISSMFSASPAQTTNIHSQGSQILAGDANGAVRLFDIRAGRACFEKAFAGESDFNPVLSIEQLDNYILVCLRDSVNLLDVRNHGREFWQSDKTVCFDSGVNTAKFFRRKESLRVVYNQVGLKEIQSLSVSTMAKKKSALKLKKKLLSFACNFKDQELTVLEGSEDLCLSFHAGAKRTYIDQINVPNDVFDVVLSADSNALITIGTKQCGIYSLDNNQMKGIIDQSVCLQ